jgi:predicted NBD/HSP70 family sugar kinase
LSSDKLEFKKIASNGTQSLILNAIKDNSFISRSGIASLSGQPHAAISRSVGALLQRGVLTESALADTTGPRRKRGLALSPDYGYCLAMEYSASGIEGFALNTAFAKVFSHSLASDLSSLDRNSRLDQIIAFARELIQKSASLHGICLGLAIIDPGMIDHAGGTAILSTTLEDWNNVPIVSILEQHLNVSVMLLNTSLAKILAIDRFELNGSSENLIYIEYGDGIGCGFKLAGRFIAGQSNLAGELGHLRVTDQPIACRCGGHGCLESVAALPALVRIAGESLARNSTSTLRKIIEMHGLDILNAASENDRLAVHIVDEAFEYIGRAVAGLINIVNPQKVIFDHTLSLAGPESFATLRRSLEKNILETHRRDLEIRISSLDSCIGAMGGAVAVLEKSLQAK